VAIEALAEALYKAPFGCVIDEAGAAGVADPLVVYANRGALELLGSKWGEVVEQPAAAAYSLEQQVGGLGLRRSWGCVGSPAWGVSLQLQHLGQAHCTAGLAQQLLLGRHPRPHRRLDWGGGLFWGRERGGRSPHRRRTACRGG
jgi:hypothetical protein